MASIHRSQLRLAQLTGSLDSSQAASGGSLNAPSMQLVLDHLASGMKLISGQDFHNTTVSTLKDSAGHDRIEYANGSDTVLSRDDGTASLTVAAASGDVTLAADLAVNGGDISYGNAQAATLSIAPTAEDTVGQSLSISAGATTAGTSADIAGGALTIKGGQGKGTGAGGAITFQVAEAAGSTANTANAYATALTIAQDKNITAAANLIVQGDFTVNGDTTTIDVNNMRVEDELIVLNRSNSGNPAVDIGLVFQRGNGSVVNTDNRSILWDESADSFALVDTPTEAGTTTGDVTINAYSDLHVGDVVVKQDGGTLGFGENADVSLTHVHDIGLLLNSDKQLQFGAAATKIFQSAANQLDLQADGQIELTSPSVSLIDDGGTTAPSLKFYEGAGGAIADRFIALKSPDTNAEANFTMTLPAVGLTQGVLTDIGSGVLEFKDVFADGQKLQIPIEAQLVSGSDAQGNQAFRAEAGLLIQTNLDSAALAKRMDVFVNGQLLLEGTDAEVGAGNADYVMPAPAKLGMLQVVDHGTLAANFTLAVGGDSYANIPKGADAAAAAANIAAAVDGNNNNTAVVSWRNDSIVIFGSNSPKSIGAVSGLAIKSIADSVSPSFAFDLEVDDVVTALIR